MILLQSKDLNFSKKKEKGKDMNTHVTRRYTIRTQKLLSQS